MHIDNSIISALNRILKNELTAINQYFLHARILKHQGFMSLADTEYKGSIGVMKHADQLVERILHLGGIPNMQELAEVSVGKTVGEILQCDDALAEQGQKDLSAAIALCKKQDDIPSLELLTKIQSSEQIRKAYIQSEIKVLETLGSILPQACNS